MSKTLPIKLRGNKLYQTNKQTKTVGFRINDNRQYYKKRNEIKQKEKKAIILVRIP